MFPHRRPRRPESVGDLTLGQFGNKEKDDDGGTLFF
jgi:hypothetical protein